MTNNYLTIMQGSGFGSAVNGITRRSVGGGSCLDHCFVKCQNILFESIKSVILESDLSDHYPILVNIPLGKHRSQDNQIKKKVDHYRYINFDALSERMMVEDWGDVLGEDDVQIATNFF